MAATASSPYVGTLYRSDPAYLSPIARRLLERGVLKWAITLAASLGAILDVIDTVITNVALPDILMFSRTLADAALHAPTENSRRARAGQMKTGPLPRDRFPG